MNEDEVNNNQPEEDVWQPPPLPEEIVEEEIAEPEMSEGGTLGNIFIEPGRTFEDLRRKPRFIMAGLIMIFLFSAFQITFIQKFGFENIVKSQLEANERVQQLPEDQKQQLIEQQTSPVFKYIAMGVAPIFILFSFFIGGLILWVCSLIMGGTAGYLHGVSVWVYSSLPPTIIALIVNFIVMFLKAPEEINLAASQSGLFQANPTLFMNAGEAPVLAAVLGSFDLFAIWGWVLAAIGLNKVGKISNGSAWGIVAILFLIVLTGKALWALLFG